MVRLPKLGYARELRIGFVSELLVNNEYSKESSAKS